jgi:cell wall-associated NlpC family hydrolase
MLSAVRRLKWPLVVVLAVGALGAGAIAYATGGDDASAPPPRASIEDWRWAPRAEPPQPPPEPEPAKPKRPKRDEQPALGSSEPEIVRDPDPEPAPEPPPPPPPLPETSDDEAVTRAEVLDNGVALPPLEAPPEIRAIIEAGNTIARTPYKWGGGHGKWQDTGYDCSGSVSYALAAAGLLNGPQASGPLMKWGRPGKGKWLTVYSSPGHVFLYVAGVRFDTSAANRGKTGSRFSNDLRSTGGFVARHWPGL